MHRGIYGKNKREIAEILKAQGVNPTTQRIEIAHFLLAKPQHLAADEILQQLNREYEQVSQATVYNTLRLFVEKEVIRELVISPDRIYYDSNISAHHHFIDTDTGKIYDLKAEDVQLPRVDHLDADIDEISVLMKGRLKGKAPGPS
ncbi:MAG: transcriptional repressor [bacterium]|nr:transcriptional repressor [bacterium]